jgi:hypothetical protein
MIHRFAFAPFCLLGLTFAVACASPSPTSTATPLTVTVPTPQVIEITPTTWVVTATLAPTDTTTPTPTATPTSEPTGTPTPAMLTIGNLSIPAPSADLFETNTDSPIGQYAEAFGLDPSQVKSGLTPHLRTGVSGNQLVTYDSTDGNTLLIGSKNQDTGEWVWTGETLRPAFDALGIKIGGAVDDTEPYDQSIYRRTTENSFDVFWCSSVFDPDTIDTITKRSGGKTVGAAFRDFADEGNSILYMHPGFVLYNQAILENKSPDEVKTAMKLRIKDMMQYANKTNHLHPEPTYINIYNEPFVQYNADGVMWKPNLIPNQVFGRDALAETYMMFWDEAQSRGLTIGKDVFLNISEYSIDVPNTARMIFAFNEFDYTKDQIAKRLQQRGIIITKEQVPLDLAMEQRFDQNATTYYPPTDSPPQAPTAEELTAAVTKFKKIFPHIYFTEITFMNASNEQRQTFFDMLVRVAKQTGVDTIQFEAPLRFPNDYNNTHVPDIKAANVDLFTPQYQKSLQYYNLVREAVSLLSSQSP